MSWIKEADRTAESVDSEESVTPDDEYDTTSRKTKILTPPTKNNVTQSMKGEEQMGKNKEKSIGKEASVSYEEYKKSLREMERRFMRRQRQQEKNILANLDAVKSTQEETFRLLKSKGSRDESQYSDGDEAVSDKSTTPTINQLLDSEEDKITILGMVLHRELVAKAATARTGKKRVNALIDAMWTCEERQNLKVRKVRNENVVLITKEQLSKIRELALYLNKHRVLDKSSLRQSKINEYVSQKLRADKYRKSEKFLKKQALLIRENNQKRNVDNEDESDEERQALSIEHSEIEVNSMDTEVQKHGQQQEYVNNDNSLRLTALTPRKTLSRCGSEEKRKVTAKRHLQRNFFTTDTGAAATSAKKQHTKESACTEDVGCSYEHLIQMLGKPLTDQCLKEKSTDNEFYTWIQLRKKSKLSDTDLSRIMTKDSHVIMANRQCRLIDIKFENKMVKDMCEAMCTACDENFTASYDDLQKVLTHGPLSDWCLLTYIFNKYTTEVISKKPGAMRRTLSFPKIFALNIQMTLMTNATYKCSELITATLNLPYCRIAEELAAKMLQLDKNETNGSDHLMTLEKMPETMILEGKGIILRNFKKHMPKRSE